MLSEERNQLHVLPLEPYTAALGETRSVEGVRIVEEPAAFPWSSVEKPLSQLVDRGGEPPEGHAGPVPFTPERRAGCPYHTALIEHRGGEIT
ncbi:MAG: hypothetical protein DLM58_21295 [Pseudonocardiales bacterium]|nr:MAG: hypothetical protein DLM58_21295 [Pseudonocardiales bacterium]